MLELQQLDRKFEAWTSSSKTDQTAGRILSSQPPAYSKDISKDLPPEVVAFDVNFLSVLESNAEIAVLIFYQFKHYEDRI